VPWERPFEARFIKNMELVVLARLKWHVCAITAVSFLDRLLYGAARRASLLKDDGLLHRMRSRVGLLVMRCLPGELLGPLYLTSQLHALGADSRLILSAGGISTMCIFQGYQVGWLGCLIAPSCMNTISCNIALFFLSCLGL
jgi:hypothetical protein